MKKLPVLLTACWLLPAAILSDPAYGGISKTAWGETPDHQKVDLYTLTNANGMTVKLSTYGAVIQSLQVPDRNGRMADIVRGFDSLAGGSTYKNTWILFYFKLFFSGRDIYLIENV
jgi:aldose 1-epimerase